jgi:hypothetical protein
MRKAGGNEDDVTSSFIMYATELHLTIALTKGSCRDLTGHRV